MKLSETTEELNISVYIQFQTSISFLKSDTGSQSWGPRKKLKFEPPISVAGMEPTPRSLFLKALSEFLSDRLDIGTKTFRIEFRTNRALAPWVSRYQDFIAHP